MNSPSAIPTKARVPAKIRLVGAVILGVLTAFFGRQHFYPGVAAQGWSSQVAYQAAAKTRCMTPSQEASTYQKQKMGPSVSIPNVLLALQSDQLVEHRAQWGGVVKGTEFFCLTRSCTSVSRASSVDPEFQMLDIRGPVPTSAGGVGMAVSSCTELGYDNLIEDRITLLAARSCNWSIRIEKA